VDQSAAFGVVISFSGKGRALDELVDWYAGFLWRTWPTVDGAVDVRLLVERGKTDTAIALQRWRDRPSYEAYRQTVGQESAKRILKLSHHIEHCLPIAKVGDAGEATTHFCLRLSAGSDSEAVGEQIRAGVQRDSAHAPGFCGAQLFLTEPKDEIIAVLSWKSHEEFLAWRQSQPGRASSEWLRSFKPKVWKLTQVARELGLAYV